MELTDLNKLMNQIWSIVFSEEMEIARQGLVNTTMVDIAQVEDSAIKLIGERARKAFREKQGL